MYPTTYGDNLSCFSIHFLHFLFHPFNNITTVSKSWHHPCVYRWNTCFAFNFDMNVALNLLKNNVNEYPCFIRLKTSVKEIFQLQLNLPQPFSILFVWDSIVPQSTPEFFASSGLGRTCVDLSFPPNSLHWKSLFCLYWLPCMR